MHIATTNEIADAIAQYAMIWMMVRFSLSESISFSREAIVSDADESSNIVRSKGC